MVKIKYHLIMPPEVCKCPIHILQHLKFNFSHYSLFLSMFLLFLVLPIFFPCSLLLFVCLLNAREVPQILQIPGYQVTLKNEALKIYWKHCGCRKDNQMIGLTLVQPGDHLSSESNFLNSSFFWSLPCSDSHYPVIFWSFTLGL